MNRVVSYCACERAIMTQFVATSVFRSTTNWRRDNWVVLAGYGCSDTIRWFVASPRACHEQYEEVLPGGLKKY